MSDDDDNDLKALEALEKTLEAFPNIKFLVRKVVESHTLAPGIIQLILVKELTIVTGPGDTFITKDSIAQNQGRGQTNIGSEQHASISQTQNIDLAALVPELEKLREALVATAKTVEQHVALGQVAAAQQAAQQGDKSKFWEIIKTIGGGAGKWVAEVAAKIGCKMLTGVLLGGAAPTVDV